MRSGCSLRDITIALTVSEAAAEACAQILSQTNAYDRGFAFLGCEMPGCLCDGWRLFQRSIQKVYNCSFPCCQQALGDVRSQSPDIENMIRVVIGFCASNGFFQSNWTDPLELITPTPGKYSNFMGSCNHAQFKDRSKFHIMSDGNTTSERNSLS